MRIWNNNFTNMTTISNITQNTLSPFTHTHTLMIVSRWWILTNYLSFHFPSMEIPVAATSSARKRTIRPFLSARHELPAPIHSIATNIRRMILLTLGVPYSSNHWRWCTRVSPWAIFLHYHLAFLHDPPKP